MDDKKTQRTDGGGMTDIESMGAELEKFIYHPHPTTEEREKAHRCLVKLLEISGPLGMAAK